MKNFLTNLVNFFTNLYFIAGSCVLAVIFGIIANNTDWKWAFWAMMASWIYPVIYFLIAIVYGWIINPINDYLASKKNTK